jgi:hypothetical protein
VSFYGRMGGVVPVPDEILDAINQYYAHTAALT